MSNRDAVWDVIVKRAESTYQDDRRQEQKVTSFLETDLGKKYWAEWERASYEDATGDNPDEPTLRQEAWASVTKRAARLTEVAPAKPLAMAVEEVLSTTDGKSLYGLYSHPVYSKRPSSFLREQILKGEVDQADELRSALRLL